MILKRFYFYKNRAFFIEKSIIHLRRIVSEMIHGNGKLLFLKRK